MTLDEAIAHCLEVAEQNETKALRIGRQYKGTLLNRDAKECRRCANKTNCDMHAIAADMVLRGEY